MSEVLAPMIMRRLPKGVSVPHLSRACWIDQRVLRKIHQSKRKIKLNFYLQRSKQAGVARYMYPATPKVQPPFGNKQRHVT